MDRLKRLEIAFEDGAQATVAFPVVMAAAP